MLKTRSITQVMERTLTKLKNAFLYCGLTKDEYGSIKRESSYKSNFRIWKNLNVVMLAFFAVLPIISLSTPGWETLGFIQLGIFVYSLIVTLLFLFRLKQDSLAAQFIIYTNMIILLGYAMYVTLGHKDQMAVTFSIFLVLLPMFMIDKPYFMAMLLSIASVVYLSHAYVLKDPSIMKTETIDICVFTVLGIIINTFYNSLQTKRFMKNKQLKDYNERLEAMNESMIGILADIVENKDAESGHHIERVKGFSYILAKTVMEKCPEYHIDNNYLTVLTNASALHDVGKLSIPDSIISKPARLSPEEWEIMKLHCEKGCSIIKKMGRNWSREYLEMGLEICLNHHEKWDGNGYPRGLKGDEIPISAQIVSIADIYDALTSERAYKPAFSHEKAVDMILNGDCGAFSIKMLYCFQECCDDFRVHADDPTKTELPHLDSSSYLIFTG